ncbi:MAG: GNAT family N-acetyltransferase [Clostridia bacterium]|nr:GNAT family N-acetyltransferase [Clostridia bacterium]
MIRKACEKDISAVARIYEDIHTMEEKGLLTTGWLRGIYPVRETAEKAVLNGELYVLEEDGEILASARINRHQEPEYDHVEWQNAADDTEVLVMHTLVVSPGASGKGYGKAFAAYYENMAREMGMKVLRIDTNARNSRARKLYAGLGYREAGIVPTTFNGIPGVNLVCLEKPVK